MARNDTLTNHTDWKLADNWFAFTFYTIIIILTVHALALFAHEYAHSFTAWLIGWKSNPLALDYGHLTTANIIVQIQIDENVDYDPIFAGGHGLQAAIIAGAGMIIGNGFISYPISLLGYYAAKQRGSRTLGLFFYWLCICSIGNFIDYVPIRTFASHSDIHTIVTGLACSPWCLIVILGIPIIIVFAHFYSKLVPAAMVWFFPESAARRVIMILLTALALFGFYGAAVGWAGYGKEAHFMAVICLFILLPLMTFISWWCTARLKANT